MPSGRGALLLASAMVLGLAQNGQAACTRASDLMRVARVESALSRGYGVQYWGADYSAQALAQAPHGLLILEGTKVGAIDTADGTEQRFTKADIDQIRAQGHVVLLYLNLTEVEPWRDYRKSDGTEPDIVGPATGPEETLAKWWTPEWRDVLLARVDALMATGADGIFLDDALHYYTTGSMELSDPAAPSSVPEAAASLMSLVLAVTDRMRVTNCDAISVVNNAVFVGRDAGAAEAAQFDQYRAAIDGILVESALGAANHNDLHTALREDYLGYRLPVLTLDFAQNAEADAVATEARQLGYAPYITPDASFSALAVNRPSR